jgi:transitional endoplasmic reticulum ATPase
MHTNSSPKRDYKGIGFRLIYVFALFLCFPGLFQFDIAVWSATRVDGILKHYSVVMLATALSLAQCFSLVKILMTRDIVFLALASCTMIAQLLLVGFGLSIEFKVDYYLNMLFMLFLVLFIAYKWMLHEIDLSKIENGHQREMAVVVPGGNSAQGGESADQSASLKYLAELSQVSFDDIHGMTDLKNRLLVAISEIIGQYRAPLSHTVPHSQRQSQLQPNHTVRQKLPRNGILLFGEPGNGKTYFVQALAGEIGLPLICVTYGDVASKWVNDTTQNVMKVFQDARAQAPCMLFLDEIDSFIPNRDDASGATDEVTKTTNTILTEMVDLRAKGVVLVGATNFFDNLDRAAIREGRFDFKIEITPPDEQARYAILIDALHQQKTPIPYSPDSVRNVTQRWEGYSVKRIQAVAEEIDTLKKEVYIASIDSRILKIALRRVQGRKGKLPESTKTLEQLILPEKLRQQLNTIATRMKDVEAIERLGGTVPTGLLLFGQPGTGKTETARSLAKETDFAFLSTTGNDLMNDAKEIDRILKEARDIRPCIIFIDEADDILANRKGSNVTSVTNKLLTAMDGAGGKIKDIVYIAATNHPDHIDPAALRGGRFTEKLFFPLPDQIGLTSFIQQWIEETRAHFMEDATPESIAGIIGSEVSIADAAAILQEAVNHMIGRSRGDGIANVTRQDVFEAKSTILGSIEND